MEYKELATSKYLCFYSSLTENSRRNWQIPRSKWVSKCKYTSDVISLKNVCVLAHMHECMCISCVPMSTVTTKESNLYSKTGLHFLNSGKFQA